MEFELYCLTSMVNHGSNHKIVHFACKRDLSNRKFGMFRNRTYILINPFKKLRNYTFSTQSHLYSTFSSQKCTILMISNLSTETQKISLTSKVSNIMDHPVFEIAAQSLSHNVPQTIHQRECPDRTENPDKKHPDQGLDHHGPRFG